MVQTDLDGAGHLCPIGSGGVSVFARFGGSSSPEQYFALLIAIRPLTATGTPAESTSLEADVSHD